MKNRVIVLGAGMVGTCTALHLQARGFDVVLIDRRSPGLETSYGNAGLIQQEAVEPYAIPQDFGFLLQSALGLRTEVNWHANAMPQMLPSLWRYYKNSSTAKHALATQAYSRLTAHANSEHQPLITQSESEELITRSGFRFVYRTQQAFDEGCERAARLHQDYGVRSQILDATALAQAEPALRIPLAGSVHWQDSWAVSDPGALVQRYAQLFVANGGQIRLGDANTLAHHGANWHLQTEDGELNAAQVVIALGPWSNAFVKKLGYSMPVFIKRGYHQHYKQ
ncbi:MAG TPA: FAD-dependent oxidoreductase, partial [Burkholderiaceae bacterium]|nr:FAD-dependent oxidoreductase [Burkholderiaceae bacterium]